METLPEIPLELVFDHLSLRDALHASYVSRTWHELLLPYLRRRYNVNDYLTCFEDPASMIKVMRATNTILSGSRALAYFLPSIRRHVQSSDWDFYVTEQDREIVHREFVLQGYFLVRRKKSEGILYPFTLLEYRNIDGETLQLVALHANITAFHILKDFHMSIVQNCISGFGCYSIFWGTTFRKEGWFAKRLDDFKEYREKLAQKQAARGFDMIEYMWRNHEVSDSENVFAVYWKGHGFASTVAYLSYDELKMDLEARETEFQKKINRLKRLGHIF
jgi:hypothetical protein